MSTNTIEWNKIEDVLPPYGEKVMLIIKSVNEKPYLTIGYLDSTDMHGNHFYHVGRNLSQSGVQILTTNKSVAKWTELPKV
jgi:hypothetical protein